MATTRPERHHDDEDHTYTIKCHRDIRTRQPTHLLSGTARSPRIWMRTSPDSDLQEAQRNEAVSMPGADHAAQGTVDMPRQKK